MVLTSQVPIGLNPLWRSPPFQGVLIWCQSYHGEYPCLFGDVAVSSGDRTGSSTQVSIIKRAWALVAMSCRANHLMSLLLKAVTP
jgi:hypothetical protein